MEQKFKLVICESTTGIVLNTELEYYNKNIDKTDVIWFDSLSAAKKIITELLLKGKSNISFEVFDENNNRIYEYDI